MVWKIPKKKKKTKIEFPEIEMTTSKMKNTLNGINNRVHNNKIHYRRRD